MIITCARCSHVYAVRPDVALARVFIEDSRANHLEVACLTCDHREVIFLGADKLGALLAEEALPTLVEPRASEALQARAAQAWDAADRIVRLARGLKDGSLKDGKDGKDGGFAGRMPPGTVGQQRLPAPEEQLVGSFAESLDALSPEQLWAGLGLDEDRGTA